MRTSMRVSMTVSGLLAAWCGVLPLTAADDIGGKWKIWVQAADNPREYYLELEQEGEKLSGTFISPRSGRYAIEKGSLKGDALELTVPRRFDNDVLTFVITAARKAPGRFEGKLAVNGSDAGAVTLTPVPDPVGAWDVVAYSPDGSDEYPSKLDVRSDGDALRGAVESELGRTELAAIRLEEEKLILELTLPIDGNDVAFVISVVFAAPGRLEGSWKTRDAEYTGRWTASRRVVATAAPRDEVAAPAPAAPDLAAFAGTWVGEATAGDGETRKFVLSLAAGESMIRFDDRKLALVDVSAAAGVLRFTLRLAPPDADEVVVVENSARLGESGKLEGVWKIGDEQGEWTAQRPTRL